MIRIVVMKNFSSQDDGSNFNAWRRDNRANGMWMRSMKRKRSSPKGMWMRSMKRKRVDEKIPRFFMGMNPYTYNRLPEKRAPNRQYPPEW